MKKVMLMTILSVFFSFSVFAAYSTNTLADTAKTKKIKPLKVQYTCTMHSEVLSDKPGKCPKCGMTLVKKEALKKKITK